MRKDKRRKDNYTKAEKRYQIIATVISVIIMTIEK